MSSDFQLCIKKNTLINEWRLRPILTYKSWVEMFRSCFIMSFNGREVDTFPIYTRNETSITGSEVLNEVLIITLSNGLTGSTNFCDWANVAGFHWQWQVEYLALCAILCGPRIWGMVCQSIDCNPVEGSSLLYTYHRLNLLLLSSPVVVNVSHVQEWIKAEPLFNCCSLLRLKNSIIIQSVWI